MHASAPARPLVRFVLFACAVGLAGCNRGPGEMTDMGGGPSLTFTSPMPGATFMRPRGGKVRVTFALEASPEIAKVELLAEETSSLGEIDSAPFSLGVNFSQDGARWVVAVGKDEGGAEVARARVDFTVAQIPTKTCRQELADLGIQFTPASAMPGIGDPILVSLPLNGITYYYQGQSTPQSGLMMDCTLAPRLHRLGDTLKGLGIKEVVHIGIYNYRCIGGGDPKTGCEPSQHAFATAIDLHEFRDTAGTRYNVQTDFILDPSKKTCASTPTGTKNKLLHDIACALYDQDLFNIILTPNYNADHRDHFHCDLTPGASFIQSRDPRAVGVDPELGPVGH